MLKTVLIFLSIVHLGAFLPWQNTFEEKLQEIDNDFSGNIGIYVKDLGSGEIATHQTNRDWYLASTVKIPIGIAILQRVEDGDISLDDTLELQETDFVDGSGDLMYQPTGTEYTVLELMQRMIRESDSTATDMLIRFLGEESFNRQVAERIAPGELGHISTIMQVRYDAYGEIHQNASNLTNLDIVGLKEITPLTSRYDELLKLLSIDKSDADVDNIPGAFERYYARGINSGSLETMGEILENLEGGEYLNQEHTRLLIDIMKSVSTGDRRIKAGLPDQTEWAHKTGTQIGRSCNMGIVFPENSAPVVVAACAEKYGGLRDAEKAYERIGRLMTENWF